MQETQEMRVQSLGPEDPLEESTATHSSILAWRIPWTEEPGGLQSTGSQSWTQLSRLNTHMHFFHWIHYKLSKFNFWPYLFCSLLFLMYLICNSAIQCLIFFLSFIISFSFSFYCLRVIQFTNHVLLCSPKIFLKLIF